MESLFALMAAFSFIVGIKVGTKFLSERQKKYFDFRHANKLEKIEKTSLRKITDYFKQDKNILIKFHFFPMERFIACDVEEATNLDRIHGKMQHKARKGNTSGNAMHALQYMLC